MTIFATYHRSAVSFLLILLSYQATAQKQGTFTVRFSVEQAISPDYRLNSVGIHPEFFIAKNLGISYNLRAGYALSSNRFYARYPGSVLMMLEALNAIDEDENPYDNVGIAALVLLIPQSLNLHLNFTEQLQTELFIEPLGVDYLQGELEHEMTFGTGARFYILGKKWRFAPHIGIRSAYRKNAFMFTMGIFMMKIE